MRRNLCLDDERISAITRIDEAIQLQGLPTGISATEPNIQERRYNAFEELNEMLTTISDQQRSFFDHVLFDHNAQGPFIVYGSAGTGKSFLLRLLYNAFLVDGLMPVKLAPTGVAAHTTGGHTIHNFFGIDVNDQDANHIRLENYLKIIVKLCF